MKKTEKQMVMPLIMVMGLNEYALDKVRGVETEFYLNNHILNNYKRYKLCKHKYMQLIQRQYYLQKQMEKHK